jgi:hypothetical protein
MIDATRLGPKLYQGSYPMLRVCPPFKVLVLCAKEAQSRSDERGLLTLRVRLDDSGDDITQVEWHAAVEMGRRVASLVASGHRTLVTCAAGRNRSGLVCAIALYELTLMDGKECVEHIRALRPNALTNDSFVRKLVSLPPKVREPFHARRRAPQRIGPVHQHLGLERRY